MNSKVIINLFFILFVMFSNIVNKVYGDIPNKEREALIALYKSTNGDNWFDKTGWKTPPLHSDGFAIPGTEKNWYGVTCDATNTKVVKIVLKDNDLAGTIPAELGNLSNLTHLYLHGNEQLKGEIPPELGNISNLIHLYLYENQLEGVIPPELGELSELNHLFLFSNKLSGTIPPKLENLSKLTHLYLYFNQLTGYIPPGLGSLSNLVALHLEWNQLTGGIPSELGNLLNLENLSLFENQLTGGIPPELGNLLNLKYLYIYRNQLTGTIPTELGNLSKLENLHLHHNHLSGGIPPELGNLSSLKHFDFRANQLEGAIPSAITNLNELSLCDIKWNALFTDDEAVRTFLEKKQIGGQWENTQTIAPGGVSARATSATSVEVSWIPIAYTPDAGGYRVFYSLIPGGPYTLFATTPAKYNSHLEIIGLEILTPYYFVVQTRTYPHKDNPNNTVDSRYSLEVSASTPDRNKVISGRVATETGKGIEEVILSFSPSNEFEVTNAGGYYSHVVKLGWSGTVKPAKTGFTFVPDKIEYKDVFTDKPGTDFKAKPILLGISGRVRSAGEGIKDVILTFVSDSGETGTETTDENGNYNHEVPYGWMGTVTPSKASLIFYPANKVYGYPGVTGNDKQDYLLNLSITLNASRKEDSSVIIRNEYSEIGLNVNILEIANLTIQAFVIYRKESNGDYEPIKEFPVQEPYQFNYVFTYIDKYLDKGKTYTYIGRALNAEGKVIGESKEKTI